MKLRSEIRHICHRFRGQISKAVRPLRLRTVPVARILQGGESAIPAATYARLTGDLLRPSRSILEGPHVQFLREYADLGPRLLEPARFEGTEYFRNAATCIDLTGHYFPYVREHAKVHLVAERFIRQFVEGKVVPTDTTGGHSSETAPIEVRPIWMSDCYEMVDGNHRAAAAIVRGATTLRVLVRGEPVQTPLQTHLMDVLWQQGRCELYQPVPFPEVAQWTLVRRCADRLNRILAEISSLGIRSGTYLDVGSSYGWFPAQMANRGFDAYGIERDIAAIRVGELAYGFPAEKIMRGDLVAHLRRLPKRFDVVSCFSVLHHCALGRMSVSAEELVSLLDAAAAKVLFFETGQNHEAWFRESLREWSIEYIERFLRENTSFRTIVRLGEDADAVGEFTENYGRTLWACMR